jgi:exodeoxyribonuclease VII small subunit
MNDQDKSFSLETKMQELRGILNEMQNGNLDFDTNIKLFTQGTLLIQACRTYLDGAEMSVKKLVDGAEEPFAEVEGQA